MELTENAVAAYCLLPLPSAPAFWSCLLLLPPAPDFLFQLTRKEFDALRSQFVISKGRGGRRHLPYAFTEHGAIMAANVLNSQRAIRASVQLVRAFIQLRRMLASNTELAHQLNDLEKKYDRQFKIVFDAIRQLMSPPPTHAKPIGFRASARKK